jgi:hypothetical protein
VYTTCDRKTFNLPDEFLKDIDLQCYCERKPKVVPSLCAEYGGDCLCNGVVFQMVKDGTSGPNNFYSAFNDDYTVNEVNSTSSIKCSKKNFEGINVSPGKDKVCWCDQAGKAMAPATRLQVKEYWRTQKAKIEEQEAIIEAKAKADAAKAAALAAKQAKIANL